jgi:hypothetical protein
MATTPTPTPPAPRRFSVRLPRPLWIGLAAAVLVVVAIGLRVGIPIYRQHIAIREIKGLGGTVDTRPRGPAWLRERLGNGRMKPFNEAIEVNLSSSRVNDATLRHVRWLTSLQSLNLVDTDVTDVGLGHLKQLRNLKVLYIRGTNATDAGVAELHRALPQLKVRK